MNILQKIPLEPWLQDYARKHSCAPTPGVYLWKGKRLNGFYLKTSTNFELFCVSEEDRETVGAKYLLPSGKGVQPSLHVPNQGVIQNLDPGATSELLFLCKIEGIGVVEGWKSALCLAALGFVTVHTGGCSCGVATIEKLETWQIPPTYVKYVFADSDILTNPSVAQSYGSLLEVCPNAQLFVNIETFFDKDGILRESKSSPDDWISSGDTKEMVFKKVRQIPIEWLISCHQNIAQRIYFGNLYKENVTIQARAWLNKKLSDYHVKYVSTTQELYVYSSKGYWESLSKQTLLEKILSENSPAKIPWSYNTLEGALKVLLTQYLQENSAIQRLFEKRRYVGFQNGSWDLETRQLLPHSPQHYLRGLLPFDKIEVPAQTPLEHLCPKICTWIVQRTNDVEIYANILMVFLLLVVLDLRNPERFLFLSGYSATGKSTYLKLLSRVVPENLSYSGTAEALTTDFGLQDFVGLGKTLLIFHDLGHQVPSSFVNLLRNLVSSGETQNVQRKYERTALMKFEGIVAAASNKNPFTQQQREGIIDRRMIFVPFVNRVKPEQLCNFDELFPEGELESLVSFAMNLSPRRLLEFVRIINKDALIRQGMFESFKENPRSLHLQKFRLNRTTYVLGEWILLGSPEDRENTSSLYGAYLKYLKETGVRVSEMMSFPNFRQECLPVLNSLYPEWDVVERRRLFEGKKKSGLLNLCTSPSPPRHTDKNIDLAPYRQELFWLSADNPRTSCGQPADNLRTSCGQPADNPRTSCGQPADNLRTSCGQPADNPRTSCGQEDLHQLKNFLPDEQYICEIKILQQLLWDMPSCPNDFPQTTLSPPVDLAQQWYKQTRVIAVDTEFTPGIFPKLAYIQVKFLELNVIGIWTYTNNFEGFAETFFPWLEEHVAVLGFYLLEDLRVLWKHFENVAPSPHKLLWKVFDFYTFFKYVHNGYTNRNSLAHWAERICGQKIDKTPQKTCWFETPLTNEIKKYLVGDVQILHKFLDFTKEVGLKTYINTWTGETHQYFEMSCLCDQSLLPLFLKQSLKGIHIDIVQLKKAQAESRKQKENYLEKCGISEEIFLSSKKFTEWLSTTQLPISKIASEWPKTKTGQYAVKNAEDIQAFMTQHTAHPLFQDPRILQWVADFSGLVRVQGLLKFLETFEKHLHNDQVFPRWDLVGTDTGRITVRDPALQTLPRDPLARSIVIPSNTSQVFVIADYKTIEIVIQALLAQEANMLQVFEENKDLHTYLASQAFGKSYEELNELKDVDPSEYKKIRNSMKTVNFGLQYGMGPQSLWKRLLSQGDVVDFSTAKNYHLIYHRTFPSIDLYKKICQSHFYTSCSSLPILGGTRYISSLQGRVRRPLVKKRDDSESFLNTTQIINYPIQATCTDFLKAALRSLDTLIRQGRMAANLVFTAHDEIILECDREDAPQVQDLLVREMIEVAVHICHKFSPDTAPINVDVAIGESWADKP